MQKTQFSVVLVNKAGELAKVAQVLGRARVNIEALALTDGIHTGIVKLVVDDAKRARAALKRARLPFSEQRVLAVSLEDEPGALAKLCARLAKRGLSIDYVYGSSGPGCDCDECECEGDCGCTHGVLMLSVAEIKAAQAALK